MTTQRDKLLFSARVLCWHSFGINRYTVYAYRAKLLMFLSRDNSCPIWCSTPCDSLGPVAVTLQWQPLFICFIYHVKVWDRWCCTLVTTQGPFAGALLVHLSWNPGNSCCTSVQLMYHDRPSCAALLWQPLVQLMQVNLSRDNTRANCNESPVTKLLCTAPDNPAPEFSLSWPYKTSIHHTNCLSMYEYTVKAGYATVSIQNNFTEALFSNLIILYGRHRECKNQLEVLYALLDMLTII